MAILICEGACSKGTVQQYDQLVKAALGSGWEKPPVTPELRGLRKQWVYTDHWGNGSAAKLQVCGVCGTVRRYGEPLV